MNKKEKNRNRRITGWIVAAILIVIFVISGRLLLKSDWLFDKLRDMAVRQANEQLRGSLSLGSIRGDLVNGFTVYDINVQDTSATEVARIDSVNISYNFFELLFSPHTVHSLEIYGTNALLEQYADSSWNVLQLLPPDDQPAEESDPLYWYVEEAALAGINIQVRSDQYLPDGYLFVDNAFANFSAGVMDSGISGSLRELEFSLREGRLSEPVNVYLAGDARQDRYTLDSIVISTGRSMLRGSGRYQEGGEIEQNLQLSPLSWQDISEYAAETPIEQNLQLELSADGTLDNLQLSLDARADGLDQLQVRAVSSLREPMSLKELTFSLENLNAPLLTGLERAPVIQSINLTGAGTVLFSALDESAWEGTFEMEGTAFEPYKIDLLNASYVFDDGSLAIDGNVQNQGEEVHLAAGVDSLFGDKPAWEFNAESNQMNPATWLQNEEYAGNLNLSIAANGAGFSADNFESSADVLISGNQIQGQAFSRLHFTGDLNHNRLNGQLSGQLRESSANMEFTLFDWQSVPEYEFNLKMNRLNLAEINGLEEFSTYLNGTVEGQGTSFDPEQMRMTATANFDSSIVNGEEVQELNTDVRIENQFVIVDEGLMESPIANASFSLNHHLFEITNSENRLNFNASLKDLAPLAPLFGIERLQSEGSVSGNLGRNADGILEFNGDLDLENIAVDTLFSAEQISGRLGSYITDEPEFDLNIKLTEPSVYESGVQDMQLYVYAKRHEHETSGNISINLENGSNSSLRQSGEFSIDSTKTTLITRTLDFETQLRQLTLEKPFNLTYSNNTLSVDTLTISTDQGDAHLQFWAPRIDSLTQQGGLNAQNLNIGKLQETLLKESYFDGHLNGNITVYNSPDSLNASVVGYLTELSLSEGEMDSLKINMDIKNEWLTAELESWHEKQKLAEGFFRVPFLPGDPLTFDDQFFERDINGRFEVYESQLDYWLSFMEEGPPEDTNGTLALTAEMGGIAGNPALDGTFTVSDGSFSGIEVDSVRVELTYFHEDEKVDLNGSIVKDKRRILDFESSLPFLVDLKQVEIQYPSGEDEVFMNIKTNNFDLALLNSYVDRELVREISGRLEGGVILSGVMDNLQAEGEIELAKGSMRIVPAGITLSEMSSMVLFRQDKMELQRFSAKSGPGRFRANGSAEIHGFETGEMNINITANQFRLFNTPEYNALINLDAKMNGTASEPELKGNLTFLDGFLVLQDFGERSVESVELEDEDQEESYDLYESLSMEFTVGFARQFLIRNRQYLDMEIELGGEVDLVKEPEQELQVFGTLEGVDGYARPLGKEFGFEEAYVTFAGPIDNPELNIRSSYKPPQAAGVQIFYIIGGTLEEPEFRFDSQPQLELQDIISYTLFGRPFYELESWEQVVAGSGSSPSAADYALEVLLDRVELLASQRLGIDVVQIDNSRSGSNNTVIKTGWYLSQSTFFAILNEIDGANPKTLFMLEILLRENLELIITQGDDTRQGIDLQWKWDY